MSEKMWLLPGGALIPLSKCLPGSDWKKVDVEITEPRKPQMREFEGWYDFQLDPEVAWDAYIVLAGCPGKGFRRARVRIEEILE